MNQIRLKEVTKENIEDILQLQVKESQKSFVATTSKSLAYAYVSRDAVSPYGIYEEEQLIGYVSLIFDENDQMYNIWHFLIDAKYQGYGYGKKAMRAVMYNIREKAYGLTNTIALGVDLNNKLAIHLYEEFGFIDSGETDDDGELIMLCKI